VAIPSYGFTRTSSRGRAFCECSIIRALGGSIGPARGRVYADNLNEKPSRGDEEGFRDAQSTFYFSLLTRSPKFDHGHGNGSTAIVPRFYLWKDDLLRRSKSSFRSCLKRQSEWMSSPSSKRASASTTTASTSALYASLIQRQQSFASALAGQYVKPRPQL
jgi:hypothetical protein